MSTCASLPGAELDVTSVTTTDPFRALGICCTGSRLGDLRLYCITLLETSQHCCFIWQAKCQPMSLNWSQLHVLRNAQIVSYLQGAWNYLLYPPLGMAPDTKEVACHMQTMFCKCNDKSKCLADQVRALFSSWPPPG